MRTALIPTELNLILNNYFKKYTRTIKSKCFLCEIRFDKLLRLHKFDFPEYDVKEIEVRESNNYLHGIYEILLHETKEELGIFHVIQTNDEVYVMSGEKSSFFEQDVLQIFKSMYPVMIPAFIHSEEIYQILENFEKVKNIDLVAKKVVDKRIFGKEPRTGIIYETYKKDRVYRNYKEAFFQAKQYELWIDKIKVYGKNRDIGIESQFSISRRGEVSIEKGTFDTYFTYVLAPISDFSKNRMSQFRGRSRKDQADKKPKPLIVKFGNEVFEKTETRKDFIKILEKYPNCNYSIIHNGNPHVYLSVLDRIDNSSFSVRTLGNNSLLLIPQIKTSAISLMRFSEFLVSYFYEGMIENYEQEKN